jgi:hypothetical protein
MMTTGTPSGDTARQKEKNHQMTKSKRARDGSHGMVAYESNLPYFTSKICRALLLVFLFCFACFSRQHKEEH